MSELTKKQNEVIDLIRNEYNIVVSKKWFNKYLYHYAKCTPLENITMVEALERIKKDPSSFCFFVYGMRAEFVNKRMK